MKIIDRPYQCQILSQDNVSQDNGIWQLHCHLCIVQSHTGTQTVIISDMGFEMGWFIPHLVEKLVEQIVKEFYLNPTQLVWLEQYSSANDRAINTTEFSQVTVEWQNGKAVNPQWVAIAPEAVEELIREIAYCPIACTLPTPRLESPSRKILEILASIMPILVPVEKLSLIQTKST